MKDLVIGSELKYLYPNYLKLKTAAFKCVLSCLHQKDNVGTNILCKNFAEINLIKKNCEILYPKISKFDFNSI